VLKSCVQSTRRVNRYRKIGAPLKTIEINVIDGKNSSLLAPGGACEGFTSKVSLIVLSKHPSITPNPRLEFLPDTMQNTKAVYLSR
jgi:hypothetical protein